MRGHLLAELHESMASLEGIGQRGGFGRADELISDPELVSLIRVYERGYPAEVGGSGRNATMNVISLAPSELIGLGNTLARAMPAFDETEQRLAVELYRELASGESVSTTWLATRVGLPVEEVTAILGRWPGVYRDSREAVIGFMGLTLAEMPPHRFEVGGQQLWTWCSWDSLFIPVILGKTARVESVCAMTGAPVSLIVTPEGVAEVSPTGAVISFLRPEREFDQDVILSFCHHVLFFSSEEAGNAWAAARANAFLLTIEQGFALGQRVVKAKFEAALGAATHGSV